MSLSGFLGNQDKTSPEKRGEHKAADYQLPRGLAIAILRMGSLLDSAGIPSEVFTGEGVRNYLTLAISDRASPEEKTLLTMRWIQDALAQLHRLSLIEYNGTTVRIHALVQRSFRDELSAEDLEQLARVTADALIEVWPDPELKPALSNALRSNTIILRQHASSALFVPSAHPVLFQSGRSLGKNGQANEARIYFQELLDACTQHFEPDHTSILTARKNLATWRGEAGDANKATDELKQLLDAYHRVLGQDHPESLGIRSILAYWRGQAGDPVGAAADFEQLLTDRSHALGPDHASTLITRGDLAIWRGESGDPAGAVVELEQLLADRLRILGPDHRRTLITRSHLARWRGESGNPAGAVVELEQLLADRLRILGPDHPDTLATKNQLASWRGEAANPVDSAEPPGTRFSPQ